MKKIKRIKDRIVIELVNYGSWFKWSVPENELLNGLKRKDISTPGTRFAGQLNTTLSSNQLAKELIKS